MGIVSHELVPSYLSPWSTAALAPGEGTCTQMKSDILIGGRRARRSDWGPTSLVRAGASRVITSTLAINR